MVDDLVEGGDFRGPSPVVSELLLCFLPRACVEPEHTGWFGGLWLEVVF